jgi:hypothetical protein
MRDNKIIQYGAIQDSKYLGLIFLSYSENGEWMWFSFPSRHFHMVCGIGLCESFSLKRLNKSEQKGVFECCVQFCLSCQVMCAITTA